MSNETSHDRLRVVVAGGGVAGLETVLALAERACELLDVTLVVNQHDFVFRARAAGEPFRLGRSHRLSLRDIARHTGATFRHGWVTGVDAESRELLLAGNERMSYDALLLALGARSLPAYPGFATWRDNDADALAGLVRDIEDGHSRSMAMVVPPGPVWPAPAYELALLLRRWAYWMGRDTEIALVTSEERPLAAFGPAVTVAAARELERVGVGVTTGVDADLQQGPRTTIRLRPSDRTVEVDRVVALPRAQGRRLDGVATDRDGLIPVDDCFVVRDLERVWAAGDGIAWAIKHGGLAAQQAGVAAAAMAALAGADAAVEDGEASSGPLWWPLQDAVGDRLAAYLANHGAGPWCGRVQTRPAAMRASGGLAATRACRRTRSRSRGVARERPGDGCLRPSMRQPEAPFRDRRTARRTRSCASRSDPSDRRDVRSTGSAPGARGPTSAPTSTLRRTPRSSRSASRAVLREARAL
jgi:sulfide:quinone oxidoreductase